MREGGKSRMYLTDSNGGKSFNFLNPCGNFLAGVRLHEGATPECCTKMSLSIFCDGDSSPFKEGGCQGVACKLETRGRLLLLAPPPFISAQSALHSDPLPNNQLYFPVHQGEVTTGMAKLRVIKFEFKFEFEFELGPTLTGSECSINRKWSAKSRD